MKTNSDTISYHSEVFSQSDNSYGSQVVQWNLIRNVCKILWINPRSYEDEETAHLVCARWATENGIEEITPATDKD